MSDFHDFEEENADEKNLADLASTDKMVRADAIERMARIAFDKGNAAKAIIYLETSADLRQEIEDYSGLTNAFMQIGYLKAQNNHYAEAHASYLAAAENARKAMNGTLEIDALHLCGTMQRRLKNYSAAAEHFGQATNLAVEENYRFVAHIQADYARMLRKIGRTQEAEVLLAEAQQHLMAHGFETNVPRVENELASALFDDSNVQLSLEKATEAYHLAKYDENAREVDRAQFLMARCHNQMGNFVEAHKILTEMKTRNTFKKRQKHKARTDLELARTLAGLERRLESAEILANLIPVLKIHKLEEEVADALRLHGHNLMLVGEPLEAEQVLAEAIALADTLDLDRIQLEATTLLAICYEVLDRHDSKIEQYEIIASNPLNMGRLEFWMAAGELGLHYGKAGNSAVADRYITAITNAPEGSVSAGIIGQSQEAQYWMLLGQGQKLKAKNMANKAMVNYLLDDRASDASRLAVLIRDLG
jgi:tetratricopeptide (TPR) repeat protein